MKREDLDVMWSIATKKSIEDSEPFTRYEFAKMVAELQKEACAKACDDIDKSHWGCEVKASWCSEAIRAMETI